MKKKIFYFLFLIPIIIFACAKQVSLTGGPKDEIAPSLLVANPKSASLNFKSKKITLKFDEYVKLNNASQKIIFSPPISENPTMKISGKSIVITLDTSLLKPNTTYTINLPEVIGDNNENNLINSFIYCFSTGNSIDSLSISGTVINAITKKPEEDVTILIHTNFSDTAFNKIIPDYITKSDKNGKFLIPNIAEKSYHIFALKDINHNHIFDLPNEKIAFLDTTIIPYIEISDNFKNDTLIIDSLKNIMPLENDSVKTDFTNLRKIYNFKPNNINLVLFEEKKQLQFVKSYKRLFNNQLEIIFNSTQYEEFSLKVKNTENIISFAKNNPDTVLVWITDTNLIKQDSLTIFLTYKDPVFLDTIHNDTLKFKVPDKVFKDTIVSLKFAQIVQNFHDFKLSAKFPIATFDNSKFSLQIDDTTNTKIEFVLKKDSLDPRILILSADILEDVKYVLIADSACIKDVFGLENKKEELKFKTFTAADFGDLKITFTNPKNYIVELLKSDKLIYSKCVENGTVNFDRIKPDSYRIKFIEDENNNKRWDTGDYSKMLQPEKIYYYEGDYEVKKNFVHEIVY
ncbi:MAG: Ig-like domain-containing protein [Bacteroidales bacterium]|nr:Ig-like domain-containing protein [Bacteroidales bacterium]